MCFNDIIGWDSYQKTLGNLSQCQYEVCEPSQLVSLRVVRIKQRPYLDEVNSWPTIQLKFTVPKATPERKFCMYKMFYHMLSFYPMIITHYINLIIT